MVGTTIDAGTAERDIRNSRTPQELLGNLVKFGKIVYRGSEVEIGRVVGDIIFYMYHNQAQKRNYVSYTVMQNENVTYITDMKIRDFTLPKDMVDGVERRIGELETRYTKLSNARKMANRFGDLMSAENIIKVYGIRDKVKELVPQTI
jgi:hypothetical protein